MFEATPLQCIVNLFKEHKDFIWSVTIQLWLYLKCHHSTTSKLIGGIGCYLHPIFVLFREDRLYCDQCYKEQFVPRCAKCQDFITSVRIHFIIWNVLDHIIYHSNDQHLFRNFNSILTFIMIISRLFQNSGLHPRHGPVLAPRVFCLLWLFCSGWRQSSYLSQISQKICHVEKFQIFVNNLNNLWSFIEIYAVFFLNLCGENLCGEKMTNMRSAILFNIRYILYKAIYFVTWKSKVHNA